MRPFGFKTVNFKDALVCNIYSRTREYIWSPLRKFQYQNIFWCSKLLNNIIHFQWKSRTRMWNYLFIQRMNKAFCGAQNSSKRKWELYCSPPENIGNEKSTLWRPDWNWTIWKQVKQCKVLKKPVNYFWKFLKAAVSSNSPLISSGYGSPLTSVNGFISRKLKSRSIEIKLIVRSSKY